jgi:hypothetical protein
MEVTMAANAKASRTPRRNPSPQDRLESLTRATVEDAIDSIEDFGRLFSQDATEESLERVFLAAARAEYATHANGLTDATDQEIWRFLSGGALGYRLGLAVARRLAEVGR